jgi:putative FmdB family regulatory protein
MPLFDFTCQECGTSFEALVYQGEQPECPGCHGAKLTRQMSLPAAPPASEAGPMACRSEGPPCGPVCGRWKGG